MAAPQQSLGDILDSAALNDEEKAYFAARGFVSVRHLIRSVADEPDYIASIVQPFIDGVTIDGTEHKSTRPEAKTCRTSLLVAFDLAHDAVNNAGAPPLANAAVAPATAPVAQVSSATQLSPKDWESGISKWSSQWTPPGKFEINELIGGEKVLARAKFEITNSKLYTPILLTEIVAARAFKPDGSFNEGRRSSAKDSASSLDILAQSFLGAPL